MYLFRINKKVVLRVCGKKENEKKKTTRLRHVFILCFWFSTFLFFWWCMYVCTWLSVSAYVCKYVCKWLILYIWCSLRWKSRRCPGLILLFFLLFRPCTVYLWVFQINYAREWFLATAECDFTEREAVWTGFLYGLI